MSSRRQKLKDWTAKQLDAAEAAEVAAAVEASQHLQGTVKIVRMRAERAARNLAKLDAKDGTRRSRDLAYAFHLCACKCLEERRIRGTKAAVARVLNVPTPTYANILDGQQRLSLDVVGTWLQRWVAAGWPELVILANEERTLVKRRDEVEAGEFDA